VRDEGFPLLWLCGPPGAGKSAAGFEVFLRQLRAGVAAAYLDLDQIGFLSPAPADDPGGHRLKAGNLADVWRTYHAAGARRLVLSGPVPDERAAAEAGALERSGLGDLRVDTDGRSAAEVADLVAQRWLVALKARPASPRIPGLHV
jgi:hypothetical protein